jgi:sugar phosphate isomerase/epimerase
MLSSPSVQLYSVREAFAADPAAALGRLAAIGFTTVEPFGLVEHADTLEKLLPELGLVAPTAHHRFLAEDDLPAALDAARRCGVGTVVDPFVVPEQWTDRAGVDAVAAGLNAAAGPAADAGIRIAYHNHDHELTNRIGGVTALEYLVDRLDERVLLEIDTYWVAIGGADPVALLERFGDRVAAVHLKDGAVPGTTLDQVPLGEGDMPVAALLAAVPAGAVRVVEFDDYRGDVFEGVAASLRLLTS